MSGKDYVGKKYLVGGVEFVVLSVEEYPVDKVSKQYKDVLKFNAGCLVAISFRGTLIPNITDDRGVFRLTEVVVDGVTYNRPGAISKALGIVEEMYSYELVEL